MSTVDRIQQSGIGALILYLYSAGVLYLFVGDPTLYSLYALAAAPPVILVFLSSVFNDELMEFFVGKEIEEAFKAIDERTGDEEFYWDSDAETKESIDGMDERAHKHLVTILTGIGIALSLPFIVYYEFGALESAGAVGGSLIVLYLFSIRELRNLRQVVKSSVKLYD
ncbi:hypothetical protein GRX01_01755 [Halobaculum sp. WSA2]|uniref:Uncharacterized protein n=1 Tax=Halobaculum saliterrae TaxID=2073113 RepID=A0A6B0SRA7_9EURY|nr:hypothetical protein [Halobaculum saliterrae]MXR40086.1 hypothetical protein [Halobaculum saliterrae]